MKVLVVGGAGYLGGLVVDMLKNTHHVVVYDSLLYEDHYMKEIDFVYGDVRDKSALKPYLNWADAVVWLAAIVGDGACQVNPEETVAVNRDSVGWLAENFNKRIIFTSTCSVYGAQNNLLTEDSPTKPLSLYASTKLDAEKYLKNNNAVIFRLGTLFGKGNRFSRTRFDLVVNTMTMKAVMNNKLSVFGGDQYRPIVHVGDIADAITQNLKTTNTGIYNLHHMNIKIIDIAMKVQSIVPDCTLDITDMNFEDARNYKVSSNKAIDEFDFEATTTPEQGIEEIQYLVESGRIKNPDNSRYSNQNFLKEIKI